MRVCTFKYDVGSNLLGATATSANSFTPSYYSNITDGYYDQAILDLGGLYNLGDTSDLLDSRIRYVVLRETICI